VRSVKARKAAGALYPSDRPTRLIDALLGRAFAKAADTDGHPTASASTMQATETIETEVAQVIRR
jgi:hypothetical protein